MEGLPGGRVARRRYPGSDRGRADRVLVDPEDLAVFGARVTELPADPHAAERMGEAAQARVRDHFLGPRHLGQYVDLLERVLAS